MEQLCSKHSTHCLKISMPYQTQQNSDRQTDRQTDRIIGPYRVLTQRHVVNKIKTLKNEVIII